MADTPRVDDLKAGQEALTRAAWAEARAHLEVAVEFSEDARTAEALEGLSWANWWLEDVEACFEARAGAYRQYRDRGDGRGAARMALWLGDDHLEFGRAPAVAGGWFARSARILEELEPCPEHGWLAVLQAHMAIEGGDLELADRLASQARELGRRHGTVDLEMFAVATEGTIRIEQGSTEAGLVCLDEAAAAALSGEYETLAPAAWSCCLVMSSCERVRDYDRAAQWCRQIEVFSHRTGARFLRGVCRAHHGMVHAWHGSWHDAEVALAEALDELTDKRPTWRPEALVRLGQLRYRQGRLDDAETLFAQAEDHPLARYGLAAIRFDRGDPLAARDLLTRARRQRPSPGPSARVAMLELLLRIDLELGDHAATRPTLEELQSIVDEVRTDAMVATLRECEGLLAAAGSEPGRARERFEDALDIYLRLGAPVEAARTRLELASSLLALDHPTSARRAVEQALHDLEGIDAEVERARAEQLRRRLRTARDDTNEDALLTRRQVEVLRLVADGLSNRQIADRLVLSPHTVHRHLANVYSRLGCSSRPAAVAEATRHGLL